MKIAVSLVGRLFWLLPRCDACNFYFCSGPRIIDRIPINNLELVKSVDVEPATNLGKLVDLDDRTQFAANLDEIKSRIDLNDYNGMFLFKRIELNRI